MEQEWTYYNLLGLDFKTVFGRYRRKKGGYAERLMPDDTWKPINPLFLDDRLREGDLFLDEVPAPVTTAPASL